MVQRVVLSVPGEMRPVHINSLDFEFNQSDVLVMYKAHTQPENHEYMALLVKAPPETHRSDRYGFAALNQLVVRTNKLTYAHTDPKQCVRQAIHCGREVIVVTASELCRLVTNEDC